MGKHSAARRVSPREIDRLEPVSASGETLRDAARRQREVRRSPAESARRRQSTKRAALGCLGLLVLLLLVGAVVAYAWYSSVNKRMADKGEQKNPGLAAIIRKEAPRPPGDPFYMVIMGEDKRPEELRARSDTLMIAYVDPPRKRVSVLSIPRDTRVSIPGHGKLKINSAMQLGGATLVIQTVKGLTGLPISHYMEVDFNGFKDLVDAIGGVKVNVPHRISDGKAADHDGAAKLINKGEQWLDGRHALTFVRSRQFADGDFTRIKDQQIFLKALAKQTFQAGQIAHAPKIVNAIVNNVTTDLSVPQLLNLAGDFKGMAEGGMSTAMAPGEPKYIGGVSYVIPDVPEWQALVQKMESGESLEATTASATAGLPVVAASTVTVTVRNGGGQAGLAKEVSDLLQKDGFKVTEVGNTARPVYDHTLIVFKSSDVKAKLIHDTLGFGTVVKTSSLYQFKTDVLIIVGKDWRTQFPAAQQ